MKTWVRFEQAGKQAFGTLEGDTITVHTGNMFDNPTATSEKVKLSQVKLLTPCVPSKMILLWNNFHALAERLGVAVPTEPLYLLKPGTAFIGEGDTVKKPKSYDGKVVYRRRTRHRHRQALQGSFGSRRQELHLRLYLQQRRDRRRNHPERSRLSPQWTRAKGFDTFGSFGPGIVTGIEDPSKLVIKTILNGARASELPRQRHGFPAAQAGQHDFA